MSTEPAPSFKAVVFDLDGVITKTASVHSAAWKAMFDEFLKSLAKEPQTEFREFTAQDYLDYVDGKPRYEGVKSFLESRGIHLDQGNPKDGPDEKTICGLGNRKNVLFREILERDGVEQYSSTVNLVKDLKRHNIHVGVASSSKNCEMILEKTGLSPFFETRIDGVNAVELKLNGKPEPDIFVQAAKNMGCSPQETVVVEDAISGVQAGRNGQFGLVIGLAREDNAADLQKNGADVVLDDFRSTTTNDIEQWFKKKTT